MLFALLLSSVQGEETPRDTAPSLPRAGLEWRNVDVDGHRAAVFSMHTDSHGLMWLGTSQGLFLYDGWEAHAVGGKALHGVQVYAIVEHEGRLLLGTNHGFVAYSCEEGVVDSTLSKFPKEEIRCLLADGDRLLVGSLNGLYGLDLKSGKTENLSGGLPHRSVYSLLLDSRGTLYAGTYSGLARYDSSTSRFKTISQGGQDTFVNCMLESPNHKAIFIGTGKGLYRYQSADEQWSRVDEVGDKVVKSLAVNREDHMLVGTYEGLLQLTSDGTQLYRRDTREPSTPAGNQIWAVMEDASGNAFIGHERGLSIASNSHIFRSVKIRSLVDSGESNEFLTVFRDGKGNLWLGGTNGVIVRHADGTTRWHRLVDGDAGDLCVRSVMEDSHGTVWLATDGGIYRHNGSGGFDVFRLHDTSGDRVSNWVYAIRQLGDDLWVASYLGGVNRVGLSKLTGGGDVTADFSLERGKQLATDNISNMVADRKGRLWILLYGDRYLYRYNTASGKTDRYDIRQMAGSDPTHLCLDTKGRLWCAFSGGVMVYGDGEPSTVRFPSLGSDETVLAMTPVDDGVWVSTMTNLWNVDGKSLAPALLPVPQKGFAALWDDRTSGKVIAGGLDEIVEIDKASIAKGQDHGAIRMVLECTDGQVARIHNLVGDRDGLSLPYGSNISLLATALNYSPDVVPHIEYRIVKHGTDDGAEWVVLPEGTGIINLAEMSFGDYDLQVKTVGNPSPPAVVRLKVGRPFWLSWWAILFYCLLAIALAAAVFWYLRRRSMRLMQEREREEALEGVQRKLAFLSDEKQDLEQRVEQLLKTSEEMASRMRLKTITDAKPIEAESSVEKQLADIAKVVEENLSSLELNGAMIGEHCGMSEKQLYRLMKKHLGITPNEYIRNIRLQKAAMLLSQQYFMVSEVAYMVGFSAPSYFSKCFQDYYGVSPSAYNPDQQ